jgi:hypothetical protein
MKEFSPAKKTFPVEETLAVRLQRLARASLPVHYETEEKHGKRRKRFCACGEPLHTNPKIRQKLLVCDDCAAVIPRSTGGRSGMLSCAGCGASFSRWRLKIKSGRFYCKKCVK